MAYLPASEKESAWIFLTENGTEAALLDFHGRYVLLDGGETPIDMLKLFRDPECAVLSSVSSKTLPNAVALNQDGRHVPVVANLPKVSSQPSGATGELLQKLHQSAPHVLQPKIIEGRKPEPQVLFASLRNGSVDIWVLSGEAKDVENLQKAIDSGDEAKILSAARAATMVSLIVYAPFKDDEPIKRILHSGNASYEQLVKACHKLEHVPFVDAAIVSAKQYRSGAPVKKAIEKARQIGRENAAALRRQAATPAAPPAARPTAPSTRPTSGRPTPTASRPTAAAPAKPARPAATRAPATKPAVGSARTTGAVPASSRALPAARPAPASAPLTKKTIAPVKGAMLSRATSKPTTPARGGAAPAKKPAAAGQGPKPATPAVVPSAPPAAIVPTPQVPAEPSAPELPPADKPEPQPDADGTRTPEPSPVEEKFEPEQPNDEGLLDVGEPPMRLRRVSMDTDDQEAQKIIDQIGKEVNEKVEDCQRTVDAAARAYRHSLDDSEEKALVHDSHRDDRQSVERLENAAAIVPGTPKADWPVIELTDSPFASPHQSEPGPEVVDVSAPGPRSPPGAQEPEAPTLIDVTPESPAKEETAVDNALAAARPLEETPLDDVLAARADAMASAVITAAEAIRTDPSQHVEKEEEAKEEVIAGESSTVDSGSAPVAPEGSEAAGAATELDSTCGSLTAGFDAMKINGLDTATRSEATNEDSLAEVARKDSIKATEELLGALDSLGSSPFTAGLASTIASSIVEGATVDSVRQAESHPLDEPFDTTNAHQAATQIVDNAVGRKLSQDLIKHRNLRVEQNGDTEREMKFEETDPIIDKVLESISSESVEVDRKLSGQTPTEENHLPGQGGHEHEHERQAGAGHTNGHHDGNHNENTHVEDDDPYNGQKGPAAPNFWQHLPPPSSSVRMLPKLCKAIYVDLAFAPRNGTECGLVSEDMVNFYFGLCRAKNVVVPSDNLPVYFLDKWLYAKSQIKDGNFSSTIIPTIESPNLQAFRTMNEEKMASHGCSLKLALDHCSTKVQINDAEQSFHVVKVDL